jgi:hypothetical protein
MRYALWMIGNVAGVLSGRSEEAARFDADEFVHRGLSEAVVLDAFEERRIDADGMQRAEIAQAEVGESGIGDRFRILVVTGF